MLSKDWSRLAKISIAAWPRQFKRFESRIAALDLLPALF
jgi:hypothetical protein